MASVFRLRSKRGTSAAGQAAFFTADLTQTDDDLVASGIWRQTGNTPNGHTDGMVTWGRQAGIGPNGEDAWRFTHNTNAVDQQYYVGWDPAGSVGITGGGLHLPVFGTDWYCRVLLRVASTTNWRAHSGKSYTLKFISFGEGGTGYTGNPLEEPPDVDHPTKVRCICYLQGDRNAPANFRISWQMDAAWGTNSGGYNQPIGDWIYLQLGMEGSATVTGADPGDCSLDGHLKMWIGADNATYASPTGQLNNFHLASQSWPAAGGIGWNLVKLGYYSNETLDPGSSGTFGVDVAKFVVGTAFDPTWGQ